MVFIVRHKQGGEMGRTDPTPRRPASGVGPRRLSPLSALASRLGLSARHGPRRRGPSPWLAPGRAALNPRSARAGPRGPDHAHQAQRRGRRPAKAAAAVALTDDARRRGGRLRELRRRPHRERRLGWRCGRRQRRAAALSRRSTLAIFPATTTMQPRASSWLSHRR